jgi:hypothetical protein
MKRAVLKYYTASYYIKIIGKKISKVYTTPLPFRAFIFLKVELVQPAGAVRHIIFIFTGVDQQVHRKELLAEITPVQFNVENSLIEVLQFAQGEFIGQ